MSVTSTDQPEINTLRDALKGELHLPGTPGYETAGLAWNLTVDQRPAVVVTAADAQDVSLAMDHARRQGLRVAPQGTGHGAQTVECRTTFIATNKIRQAGG